MTFEQLVLEIEKSKRMGYKGYAISLLNQEYKARLEQVGFILSNINLKGFNMDVISWN